MSSHATSARRAVAVVLGAGAVLLGTAAPVIADPPPPNCTSADLAGIMAGVAAATSAYLFTHPDVNDFFTSLRGLSKDQAHAKVKQYLAANPQTKAELQGIRQPLKDIRDRCGIPGPAAR